MRDNDDDITCFMQRIEYRDGLYLPEIDLWLDAAEGRDRCVISHAHADHTALHKHIIATPETARIYTWRRDREATTNLETLNYGKRRDYGNFALTFYPAGHCLGSAQTLIETGGERIVYTGDYKLRPNIAAETAQVIPCDTLIMESTFGDPQFVFPPQVTVIERLYAAIDRAFSDNRVPVVLSYPLGKSQEALEHLLRKNYRVTMHGSVWFITEIYKDLGIKFSGEYEKYDRTKLDGRVLIAPPGCRKQAMLTNIERRYTILLTGWALHKSAPYMYKDVDLLLPLSDHADYDELIRTVKESGAQRIITMHGAPKFAKLLNEQGFNAEHLAQHPGSKKQGVKKASTAIAQRLFD